MYEYKCKFVKTNLKKAAAYWISLGNATNNGVNNGIVSALAMNGTNNLFVGGVFSSVDGGSISANNIASWDGNSWNILGTDLTNNGVDYGVYALAMNGTNQLFVGGSFTHVDGSLISANNIASWNGNSWSILGSNSTNNGVEGGTDAVYALAMNGINQLFVGGSFSSVDGSLISANNIASWDGNSWLSYGSSSDPSTSISAMIITFGNSLFVGGSFTTSPDGFCAPYLIQGRIILL